MGIGTVGGREDREKVKTYATSAMRKVIKIMTVIDARILGGSRSGAPDSKQALSSLVQCSCSSMIAPPECSFSYNIELFMKKHNALKRKLLAEETKTCY